MDVAAQARPEGFAGVRLGFRFSTGKAFGDTHKVKRQVSQLIGEHLGKALGGEALGDTHKPEAISPSLMPFTLERFLLLRQIVVNCFNSKEITSVHLNS